jgi:hypothetical protein
MFVPVAVADKTNGVLTQTDVSFVFDTNVGLDFTVTTAPIHLC